MPAEREPTTCPRDRAEAREIVGVRVGGDLEAELTRAREVIGREHDRRLHREHALARDRAGHTRRDPAQGRLRLRGPPEPPKAGLGEQHREAGQLLVGEIRVVDRGQLRERVVVPAELEASLSACQERTVSGAGLHRAPRKPFRE